MRKYSSVEQARAYAETQGLAYGWSVFSPGWFVGTREQLTAIGVHSPVMPEKVGV